LGDRMWVIKAKPPYNENTMHPFQTVFCCYILLDIYDQYMIPRAVVILFPT